MKQRKNSVGETRLQAADLFCGCGGLSCGLQNAGFQMVAGADSDAVSLATYRANFPQARALQADLTDRDADDLRRGIGFESGGLDLLAGGPPCQGFSKNVPRRSRYLEDPRNQLTGAFLRYAEAWRPRFLLMENVAEMKRGFEGTYADLLIETLESKNLGYRVSHYGIDASDYGLPQKRRRAFFLASRDNERICLPEPTHGGKGNGIFAPIPPVSVWDAMSDLPILEHGEGRETCDYATAPQNEFQEWARRGSPEIRNHVARKLQPTQYARFASLAPGQGLKDLPDELRPKSGYSGAYGRLTKEMLAPTITRWVFHPGSGRFGHPVQPRVITIREAARLQGFPDSFHFTGTYIQQSHQVGNAVPPLLAEIIGKGLAIK